MYEWYFYPFLATKKRGGGCLASSSISREHTQIERGGVVGQFTDKYPLCAHQLLSQLII